MLDVGGITSRVRDTINVVEEKVTQAASAVARFVGGDNVQPTQTQADAALHNVASQVVNLTPEEQGRIDNGVDAVFQRTNYGYAEAAIELSKQLNGQSEEYRAEFMSKLWQTAPSVAADIMRGAAGKRHYMSEGWPTEADQYNIGTSLGAAYDRGLLPTDFVNQLLTLDAKYQMPPNNEYSGSIVALSGSKNLINAYVDRSLEMAKGDDPEWVQSFNLGAARAMAGDPDILRERLEAMKPEELSDFLAHIDPKWHDTKIAGYDSGYTNALTTLVRGAARIEPPTEGVLNLFREVSLNYMGRAGMRDAMASLFTAGYTEYIRLPTGKVMDTVFHSNAEFFTQRMLATGEGVDEATQVAALKNFFQETAFSDDCMYKDSVRSQATELIRSLQSAIEYYPNVDSRTRGLIDSTIKPEPGVDPVASMKEQLAFRLGRLTGVIFQGFEGAVKNRDAENAAIDGAVDFLFGLVPFDKATDIVKGKVPGAGKLIGLGADKGLDFVKGVVKDWLHKTDLNDQRLEVWNLFAEFANDLPSYHSDDFYAGAGSVDYTLLHSGR
jgi:hypothetical protein